MDPICRLLCSTNFATILGVCVCSYPFISSLIWELVVLLRLTVHDSIAFTSLSSPTKDSTTGMNVGSLTLRVTLTGCVLLLGFSFGASPSLNTLAISALAVVEHWLLFCVASLLLDTLVSAFAIAGRWLLFYPLRMDYVPAALVVLLSCSLENRGLQLSLSLSLMHAPYPSAIRRCRHLHAADCVNAYQIGAYIVQWRIGQWTWSKPNRKELINASAKNHACTAIVASTSFNSCSHWLKLIVAFRNGSVMGSSCSFFSSASLAKVDCGLQKWKRNGLFLFFLFLCFSNAFIIGECGGVNV